MLFFTVSIITVIFNNGRSRFILWSQCLVGASLNQGSIFGVLAVLPERNSRAFLEGQVILVSFGGCVGRCGYNSGGCQCYHYRCFEHTAWSWICIFPRCRCNYWINYRSLCNPLQERKFFMVFISPHSWFIYFPTFASISPTSNIIGRPRAHS